MCEKQDIVVIMVRVC